MSETVKRNKYLSALDCLEKESGKYCETKKFSEMLASKLENAFYETATKFYRRNSARLHYKDMFDFITLDCLAKLVSKKIYNIENTFIATELKTAQFFNVVIQYIEDIYKQKDKKGIKNETKN